MTKFRDVFRYDIPNGTRLAVEAAYHVTDDEGNEHAIYVDADLANEGEERQRHRIPDTLRALADWMENEND